MNSTIQTLLPPDWQDYELLDAGEQEKLERFGKFVFIRPEPKALWHKSLDEKAWRTAIAHYERSSGGGGRWQYYQQIPSSWQMHWRNLTFLVQPTGFKHMGVFPEQASIWEFIQQKISQANRPINVLNLFAYTGGSTLAAASAGAKVTHLDAEKEILTWARENARLSGLGEKPIRWIPDDAITFVKREIKRGNKYDAIIMDPPKFGRGTQREVWKIEEDLPRLLDLCQQVVTDAPLFFLVNAYTVPFSSITLGNMLSQLMKQYKGKTTCGELVTQPVSKSFSLAHSIFGLWEEGKA
jgi:23S rRNA (cytosine1962-C5)-methyltransferase